MFDLQLSLWELLARALLIYALLFVMLRISGKRTVGQFTPFDLLVMLLVSEAVGNAFSGGDNSLQAGLIPAAVLIGVNGLLGFIGARNKRIERWLEGSPALIGRDGVWFPDVMRRHRIGEADVQKALRESDCVLTEMKLAILETDGSISIVTQR